MPKEVFLKSVKIFWDKDKVVSTSLIMFMCLFELNISQTNNEEKYITCVTYVSIVKSLMYVMVCTRSDLAQVV